MKALSGQQTVLAKPPNSVRLVIGPRAALPYMPAERGEHRIVEPGAHADAEQHPGDQINRQRRRKADAGQARGIEQ